MKYTRISADREGRALGVQRQLDECDALCTRHGLETVATFSDNDSSASSRSRKPRPDYQDMLTLVRGGGADAIVAYSTSRLTRRPREFEDLIDLAEHGVRIVTTRTGDLDLNTARGRRRARDDAARDAEYAEELSELAKAEREQRRERGQWHGGKRPFGWRPQRDAPGGLVEVPEEAALIRRACAQVLTGRTIASIARDWQYGGVEPAQAALRWHPTVVSDILRSPRLAGLLPDGRPASWTPLVAEETWRGVYAVLADPARRSNRGATRLLTGIGMCGRCGSTVHGGISSTSPQRPTYRCSGGSHLDRRSEPVDAYVTDVLLGHLAEQDLVADADGDGEVAALARDAAAVRARLAELADLVADGAMKAAEYRPRAERLRLELQAVEARASEALRGSVLSGLPLRLPELRAAWDGHAGDIGWRREVLKAAGLRVTVMPAGRGAKSFDPATVVISGGSR